MRIVPSSAPTLRYEQSLWSQGIKKVAGIDEVGRGALAGPVVTAMVVFRPDHQPITGIRDSKQLSAKARLSLSETIKNQALAWKVGVGSIELINSQGIVPALHFAVMESLGEKNWEHLLMDGLPLKPLPTALNNTSTFIVKGDQLSYSIAAASIVAKVFRDQLMIKLATELPAYGWHTNVGYGTKTHLDAIKKYGITEHHRLKFIHLETDSRSHR